MSPAKHTNIGLLLLVSFLLSLIYIPAHYFNEEWKSSLACPAGSVYQTSIKEIQYAQNGEEDLFPGKVRHVAKSACIDQTTHEIVPASGAQFWLIIFIINMSVFFSFGFALISIINKVDRKLPSDSENRAANRLVWAGLFSVVAAPFSFLIFGPDLFDSLDKITGSMTVSYFLLSFVPFCIVVAYKCYRAVNSLRFNKF